MATFLPIMGTNLPPPPTPLRPGVRWQWMLDERITFLNHGSFGAVPRCVFDEQTEWRRKIEAEPVELLGRRAAELIAAAKQPLGKWLGMRDEDFGFVTNATEGINAVLQSLTFDQGDELLTTTHVYNAVRQSMRHVAARFGAEYRELDLPLPITSPQQITTFTLESLSPRTRLLVIDHVTSPTALIFPIEPIVAACNERGVDVLIDGAHAPGMLPLNVSEIGAAYYAGNLHKWTCAPKGSGFLWVRPDRQATVHPLVVSHLYGQGFAREFGWQGTRDLSAWLTVPRAIQFMADLGWDQVMAHNHALAVWAQQLLCQRWAVEPISPLDGSMIGSMLSVRLPPPFYQLTEAQQEQFQQRLYSEQHVEAPLMQWPGPTLLRPCCQVYNTPEDYERLADAVAALASRT